MIKNAQLITITLIALCSSTLFLNVLFAQPAILESKVDKYLSPIIKGNNFSGSVLITRDNQTILSKGYGLANSSFNISNTPLTKFQIASLSKGFTATLILLLEERDMLQLDDSISMYLPELSHFKKVTIHHLLNHHSGIPDINRQPSYNELQKKAHNPESLVEIIKAFDLSFEPGKRYAYSNSNYNILARIIEVVSNKSYRAFLQQNILSPLAMMNTGHRHEMGQIVENLATGYVPSGGYTSIENAPYIDWSVKTGNGSLYSTTEDLLKWIKGLMAGKVIQKPSLEKMMENQYGWFVGEKVGETAIYYNGNSPGFSSFIGFFQEKNLVIIVLGNNDIGLATTIGEGLAALVFDKTVKEFEVIQPISINQAFIDAIVGRYKFSYYSFEIAVRDGVMVYTGGYPYYDIPMIPIAKEKLFNRFFWSNLILERDGDGQVTHIYWEGNQRQKGEKIKN